MERDEFSVGLRYNSVELSNDIRNQRLFTEFTKLLYKCSESKRLIDAEHYMDAYRSCLEALSHWARICVLEAGQYPEVSIMKQVKGINCGVYKLYEELTASSESIEQRVQLVILACEFGIVSKLEQCSIPLMDVLRSRSEYWSLEELLGMDAFKDISEGLVLLLDRLTKKAMIKVVFVAHDKDFSNLEMSFTA